MQRRWSIPMVGIAACLALLVLLVAPYAFVHWMAMDVYYQSGFLDAYTVGLITIFALGSFALELTDRVDLVTVAGAIGFLAVFLFVLAGLWAATVSPEIVMSLTIVDELAYHRWTLVALAALIVLVSAWNAATQTS